MLRKYCVLFWFGFFLSLVYVLWEYSFYPVRPIQNRVL